MTNKQSHPSLNDDRFTIRIKQFGTDLNVKAPLPDEFGFTVGSEFSAPFDGQFLSGALAKGAAAFGVASKRGVQTKKLYTSPEPTEISFDMHFEAYEDAVIDVYHPTIKIMSMSLGSTLDLEDTKEKIKKLVEPVASNVPNRFSDEIDNTGDSITELATGNPNASRAWDFLNFLEGPPTVKIRFGNVITFSEAYISSVSPSFSNIMDSDGIPMSCTVSVTAILEKDPVVDDDNFEEFFSQVKGAVR